MEMNTRIQVEHTVTELVTGLDLVREQVLVAAGEPLSVTQDDVVLRGHAIECRINAEDVGRAASCRRPGGSRRYREPAGPGVRVDSGIEAGDEVSGLYDPMIAKLIVHDVDRDRAIARMLRALAEFRIEGPSDAPRLPPRAARAPVLRRRARRARASSSRRSWRERAQELEQSFSHATTSVTGGPDGAVSTVPRLVGVEVDGRALRRAPARDRAAVGRARAATARARGRGRRRRPATAPSSARCRGRCSRSRSPTATQVDGRAAPLRRRGDEDGERDRRAAGGHRLAASPSRPARHRERSARLRRRRAGRVTLAALLERLVGDATLTGATLSRPRTSRSVRADAADGRPGRRPRRACAGASDATSRRRTTDELLDGGGARRAPLRRDRRPLPAGAPARARGRLAGPGRARRAARPPPTADPARGDARARPPEAPRPRGGRGRSVPRRARRPDPRRQGARAAAGEVPAGQPLRRARRGRRPVAAVRRSPGRRLRLGARLPHVRAARPARPAPRPRGRPPRPRREGGRRRGLRGARPPARRGRAPVRGRRHRARRPRGTSISSSACTPATPRRTPRSTGPSARARR